MTNAQGPRCAHRLSSPTLHGLPPAQEKAPVSAQCVEGTAFVLPAVSSSQTAPESLVVLPYIRHTPRRAAIPSSITIE